MNWQEIIDQARIEGKFQGWAKERVGSTNLDAFGEESIGYYARAQHGLMKIERAFDKAVLEDKVEEAAPLLLRIQNIADQFRIAKR